MKQELREFVRDALLEWGAQSEDLSDCVASYRLPDGEAGVAAWYLGRPSGELLLAYDGASWPGAECVTSMSPLVRRLEDYAISQGSWAIVTLYQPGTGPDDYVPILCPHLAARFCARYFGANVHEERRWLGISLATGTLSRGPMHPLSEHDLTPGPPLELRRADAVLNPFDGLHRLAEVWEREVAMRSRRIAADADAAYQAEVEEAARVLEGHQLAERMNLLAGRYAPSVEMQLEAGLVIWR